MFAIELAFSYRTAREEGNKTSRWVFLQSSFHYYFTPLVYLYQSAWYIQLLSNVTHCSARSHPQHTCTHIPLFPLQGLQCFQQEKKIIIKIAIIKKIYSIHFLLVYYIGIFCTWPKSSSYLHSDMEGLVLGSPILLALRGELKPTVQSSFSFPFY